MTVQTIQTGGIADVIRRVGQALQNVADAVAGVTIIPDDVVKIGKPVRLRRQRIMMHPLDVIAVTHEADPHARLDEAMEWITEQANDRFNAAIARLYREGANDA